MSEIENNSSRKPLHEPSYYFERNREPFHLASLPIASRPNLTITSPVAWNQRRITALFTQSAALQALFAGVEKEKEITCAIEARREEGETNFLLTCSRKCGKIGEKNSNSWQKGGKRKP